MSRDLIDEVAGVHVGFLHVLLGGELWYDINEDEDLYASFENSYRQMCFRTSEYMRQLPHLVWDKSEIHRCLWYWGYFTLPNLSRVLNTDDLFDLEGLREGSNIPGFICSLNYLISITPPPPRYSPNPFLCGPKWTYFQMQLPMLSQVYRQQRRIEIFVRRFAFCTIL